MLESNRTIYVDSITGLILIPLKTGDVSQFALAAFGGIAAGHKVNSPRKKCKNIH